MSKFEVVVAIYKKGSEDPLEEETILETDDYSEAQEEFESLTAVDPEDEGEAGEELLGEEEPV